ncbi:MAG TPA: hypothetical protein VF114_09610 [Candidatus Limnocylindria bacterium]
MASAIDIPGSGFSYFADDILWVMDRQDGELDARGRARGSLYAVSPDDERVMFKIPHVVGDCPVAAFGAIWLCTPATGLDAVTRIDLTTHDVDLLKTSDAANSEPEAICLGRPRHLWISNHLIGTITRLDGDTGNTQMTVGMRDSYGEAPRGKCATDLDNVWMVMSSSTQLVRFDGRRGAEIGRIDIPTPSGERWLDGVIKVGRYLFITSLNAVQKVIPAVVPTQSGRADRLVANLVFDDATAEHSYTTTDGSNLWLARSQVNRLYRIDPESFVVTGYIDLPVEPQGLTSNGRYVWVRTDGQVLKIDVSEPGRAY